MFFSLSSEERQYPEKAKKRCLLFSRVSIGSDYAVMQVPIKVVRMRTEFPYALRTLHLQSNKATDVLLHHRVQKLQTIRLDILLIVNAMSDYDELSLPILFSQLRYTVTTLREVFIERLWQTDLCWPEEKAFVDQKLARFFFRAKNLQRLSLDCYGWEDKDDVFLPALCRALAQHTPCKSFRVDAPLRNEDNSNSLPLLAEFAPTSFSLNVHHPPNALLILK